MYVPRDDPHINQKTRATPAGGIFAGKEELIICKSEKIFQPRARDFSLSRENKTDTAPKGERRKKRVYQVFACVTNTRGKCFAALSRKFICFATWQVCVAARFESARSQLFAIVKVARLNIISIYDQLAKDVNWSSRRAAFSIRQHLVIAASSSSRAGRALFNALELIYYNPTYRRWISKTSISCCKRAHTYTIINNRAAIWQTPSAAPNTSGTQLI